MKKNGFTLIELLAVIIILAVVALIATPIILNVIDDAKKSGDESNVAYYANAIELKLAERFMKNGGNYITDPTELKAIIDSVETNGKKPTNCTTKVGNGIIALKDCEEGTGKYSYIGKKTYATTEPNAEFNEKWDAMDGVIAGGSEDAGLVGTKIGEKVLTTFPNLGLDNTEAKGCATSNNNYSYMGGCYLKGTQDKNYIWFSGFLYRIMGVNKDGSVRLITEETVTAIPYNVDYNINFTGSHAEMWLNEYFLSNLKGTDKIIEGKFCQGIADSSPNLQRNDCVDGMEISKKVGTISIDEYNLSGAESAYLNISQYFFTMSPSSEKNLWGFEEQNVADTSPDSTFGLRPIINVSSSTVIMSGDGTLNNNYILNEDKTIDVTGKLDEKATSGEYVKFVNKIYRVVGKNTDGTIKLILDGHYQEPTGTNYNMSFGSNNTFTLDSGIGKKLKGDVLNWLVPTSDTTNRSKIKNDSKWYQNIFDFGKNYTEANKVNANPISATVGLINIGEILTGYSTSMSKNAMNSWLLTPYIRESSAWASYASGGSDSQDIIETAGLRPVININTDVNIVKGSGTLSSPYEI